jgi:hypothetical protein
MKLLKHKTKPFVGVIAALTLLTATSSVMANSEQWQTRLSVQQSAIYGISAGQATNINLNAGFDKVIYQQGDYAKISVSVNQPANQGAFVALVQAYPDGSLVKLFPNDFQPNNYVVGNNKFEIRGQSAAGLYVNDAPGAYLVKLIAASDKQALDNLLVNSRQSNEFKNQVENKHQYGQHVTWAFNDIGYTVSAHGAVNQPVYHPQPVVNQPQPIAAQPTTLVPISASHPLEAFKARKSDFHLSIAPKNNKYAYNLGEKITFQLTSENDCEAGLIHMSANGKMTVLYPNQMNKKVKLKENSVTWLPESSSGLSVDLNRRGTNHFLLTCSDKPNLWEWMFGRSKISDRSSVSVKPTVTVEQLLQDHPDNYEAYAYTTVIVK